MTYIVIDTDSAEDMISELYFSDSVPSPTIRILDVGAREGMEDMHMSGVDAIESLEYIGVEPDEQEYQKLVDKYPHEDIYQVALSDVSRRRTLYLTMNRAKSSLRQPNMPVVREYGLDKEEFEIVGTQQVQTVDLDSFCEENNLSFDVIKIDAQGEEGHILLGGENTLNSVHGLQFESNNVRRYRNMMTWREIDSLLHSKGFRMCRTDYFDTVASEMFYINENAPDAPLKQLITALLFRRGGYARHLLNTELQKLECIDIIEKILYRNEIDKYTW